PLGGCVARCSMMSPSPIALLPSIATSVIGRFTPPTTHAPSANAARAIGAFTGQGGATAVPSVAVGRCGAGAGGRAPPMTRCWAMPAAQTSEIQVIEVKTATREEMIDITSQVRSAIKRSGIADGICCVYCPHTTAGITIQENSDPDVKADMVAQMGRMVPK